MEETTNLEETLISEWTTAVEALDSDSIKELFDIRPELLWTPLAPLSHLETDFSHFIRRLEDYKLLGTSIRPVYALHHIIYDYGVPNDEWAPERIELVDFILKRTKGNELNTCLWSTEQNTVMHLAYFLDQPELIQQLKEYGALSNIPNKSGHLPLTPAIDTKEIEEDSTDSQPEVKLLTNNAKSKSTAAKNEPKLSASDRFKRLRELAESPNAATNTGNRALTERQNSTRRHFRPGHLEERKRRVLSEEEEAELEKQRLKRQKEVEQLAQRSAVKNNPLFKRFEEQQQQQQQPKRTPSVTAASAVRDRKKLLGAADQIRRSSRVINTLKERSYVSTSVFRQAQEAEAAAAAASGRSLKAPTLAQLRGTSPIAKDTLPTVNDEEEEEAPVEEKTNIEIVAPEKTEEIIVPAPIEETKQQTTDAIVLNNVPDKLSQADNTTNKTINTIKKNDPTPIPKLETKSNSNKDGVTEDEVDSLSVRKLGDRGISSNLKIGNNKKEIEINSSKVREIANMHEHLNDQEQIEIYSAGKKFAVWGKNGKGQVEEEEDGKKSDTYKKGSSTSEQPIANDEDKKSNKDVKTTSAAGKDISSSEISDNKPLIQPKSAARQTPQKDLSLTSDKEESLPNKLALKEQSNNAEQDTFKTGKKWSPKDRSGEQTKSSSSIATVSTFKSAQESLLSDTEETSSSVGKQQLNLQDKSSSATSKSAATGDEFTTKSNTFTKDQSDSKSLISTDKGINIDTQSLPVSATTNDKSDLTANDHPQLVPSSTSTNQSDAYIHVSKPELNNVSSQTLLANAESQQDTPSNDQTASRNISAATDLASGSSDATINDTKGSNTTSSAYLKDGKAAIAAVTSTASKSTTSVKNETSPIPVVQLESNNTITETSGSSTVNSNEATAPHSSGSKQATILTPNEEEDDDFTSAYQINNTTSTKPSNSTNNNYLNTTTYLNTIIDEPEEEEQQQPNHVHPLEINTNKSQMIIEEEESDEDEATTPTMANPQPPPPPVQQQQQQQQKKKTKQAIIEESDDEESRHEWKSAYDQLMSNQQEVEFEDDVLQHHNKTMNKSRYAAGDDRLSFSSDMDESTILKTLNYQNEAHLNAWNINNQLENQATEQHQQYSSSSGKNRLSISQYGMEHNSTKKRESQLSRGGESIAASSEAGSEQWFDPDDNWNEQQEEIRRQSLLNNPGFQIPPHEDYYYKKSEEEEDGYKRHSDSSIATDSETYSNKNSNSTENTNHDEDDERKRYQQEEEEEDYDYYSTDLHKTANMTAARGVAVVQEEEEEIDYYSTNLHTSAAAANNTNKTRGESSYYHGGPADPHQEQEEGEITVFMDQFASSSGIQEVKSRDMQKSTSQQSQDITTAFFNNTGKPILAQHQAPKPLTAATIINFSSSSLSVNQIHNNFSSSSLSIKNQSSDEISLIKIPSRTIAIAEVGGTQQQDEVPPLDPNHPRVEDISHYMNKLPTYDKTTNDIVPGGSAFDAAALSGGGLENETVVIKRAISTSHPQNGGQPVEQSRGIPNAHEINFSLMPERRFDETSSSHHKISMSSMEASEFGKMYIGVSGAHNMLLPLPKEITYVRCVISDGEYEYMSRYEILGPQILMDYECVIDTRPGMIITVSLHVRPDYHVKPRTGWSRWLTTIRKQKEHLSGYVHPEDGAIGQTRFAVDHMVPGCYKKTYEAHFDCFNSWYARTARERARREQFGDDEDFLKIIGRLNVEMLYLPVSNPSAQVPRSLRECDLTLKIRQWHDTCWQSGYLSTRRQGLKVWERHYYRLIGSQLIGYTTDGGDRQVWDHYNMSDVIRLSAAADKVLVALTTEENDDKVFGQDTIHAQTQKGFFRLAFPDYHLDCVSDDLEESEEWVKTLKSMIGRVPLRLPFSD